MQVQTVNFLVNYSNHSIFDTYGHGHEQFESFSQMLE